jgi:hypothetical protein
MNSRTKGTRWHIRLLAIGIFAGITGPVLADPAPDLLNTLQGMRKEASEANANQYRAIGTTEVTHEAKSDWVAREVNVPASQGVSSVTVIMRSGQRTQPGQFDVAPLK